MHERAVLMTADAVGGVWDYSLELARSLAGKGWRTILATMGPVPDEKRRREALKIPGLALESSLFKLEWMPDPWDDVERAGRWLLALEKEHKPDLVHLNGYVHAALPWRAPCLVAAHSCVLTWWRAVKKESAPPEYDRYRESVRAGLDHASTVVSPTRAFLSELRREYGPLGPARVILNGRDPARFRAAEKESFIFSTLRLWDEAKNMPALGEAARELGWPVRIAGEREKPVGKDGPKKSDKGRTVKREKSQDSVDPVEWLGRLSAEEMAEMHSRAAIFALPARYEPFGLTALEAALSGCALMLSDIPTQRELWDGAALFVDPEDQNSIRSALEIFITRPGLRRLMSENAHERALSFSPVRMGEEYHRLYLSLIDRDTVSSARRRRALARTPGGGERANGKEVVR